MNYNTLTLEELLPNGLAGEEWIVPESIDRNGREIYLAIAELAEGDLIDIKKSRMKDTTWGSMPFEDGTYKVKRKKLYLKLVNELDWPAARHQLTIIIKKTDEQ